MGLQFGGHTATNRGESHDTGVTHADDTLPGGFISHKPPLPHSKQAAGPAHTTKLDRKQQSE